MTSRERYQIRIKPGANAQQATTKMAKYIMDRWLPSNAGGVHVLVTPQLCKVLYPFFKRDTETLVEVDTLGGRPEITEVG